MSNEEIKTIKEQLAEYHQEHLDAHDKIMDEMKSLEDKLKPVINIYQSVDGFGSVVVWIAKYIVTPIIIILGAFVTIKKLHE